VRARLRAVLAKASEAKAARAELAKQLADPALPPIAAIDLLRAATARGAPLPSEGVSALARLARADADFRTRYLLLAPAAAAARGGDQTASAFVMTALLRDPDAHLRARAAEAAGDWPGGWESLVQVLRQSDPRVREAALGSIARLAAAPEARWSPEATRAIVEIMKQDPFTFVRLRGADALSAAPRLPEVDAALGDALADGSPAVRARVAERLGDRGALAYAKAIRERLGDDDAPVVRVSAARALGAMCDDASRDALSDAVRFGVERADSAAGVALAVAAAAALGRLHPADLADRLAPLMRKDAAPTLRQAAEAALQREDRCQASWLVRRPGADAR
jgi:HEAT repeat protein